jgi:hypothetical protein
MNRADAAFVERPGLGDRRYALGRMRVEARCDALADPPLTLTGNGSNIPSASAASSATSSTRRKAAKRG